MSKDLKNQSLQTRGTRTGPTSGILRLDIGNKQSRLGTSDRLHQGDLPSPQPSVDRLSVTFATEEKSVCSDSSVKVNFFPPLEVMDKVRFPDSPIPPEIEQENQDGTDGEEDYSASVSAIIQRRASTRRKSRKGGRRASSPFTPDITSSRRRSSVFTTSSGDTAISIEDEIHSPGQEQIIDQLRLHKEVLSGVRNQPWPMRRKLKLVIQAKKYIRRHEGALQERLASSRSTKDLLASFNLFMAQKLQHYKRELANFCNLLIPWESRIKEIESHFGSVVASYFTFLRWLFSVNFVISVVLVAFVTVPEILTSELHKLSLKNRTKFYDPRQWDFLVLWEWEGVLKDSPMFYGYYRVKKSASNGPNSFYKLPLAYFMTGLGVYVYSFVATLRKMAENSRMSKLSEKDDECVFSWKLFSGWDFMIGNSETAHNRVSSIILGFKEALLEEAEKQREPRNWKIIGIRVLVNLFVLLLLGGSAYAVVEVVQRSTEIESNASWWRRNEITIVMSLISLIFPVFFELLGFLERYHPRKQLRLQLARIMVLNLLNLYSLICALFYKIINMTKTLQSLKPTNVSKGMSSIWSPDVESSARNMNCYQIEVECNETETFTQGPNLANLAMALTNMSLLITGTLTPNSSTSLRNTRNGFLESEIQNFSSSNEFWNQNFQNFNGTDLFLDKENPNGENFSNFYEENFFQDENSTDFFRIGNNTEFSTNFFEDNFSEEENSTIFSTENSTGLTFFEENFTEPSSNFLNSSEYGDFLDTSANFSTTTEASIIFSVKGNYPVKKGTVSKVCLVPICEPKDPNLNLPSTVEPKVNQTKLEKYFSRKNLSDLCWETMFGQEMVKLTVMDLVFTILSTLGVDFFRAIFVRVMNNCWCWDLEKKFPQYGDFKIAENILHLVNNQGMVWMGMFFSPGLVVLNIIKLIVIMYLRSWAVLTCNVPHEVVFRASRSNNFYFALLLTMLFLCVLPVGYAIVWIEPSWHCGPFSNLIHKEHRIYHIFTRTLQKIVPKSLHRALDYIASPGIVIPLLVLLVLIIYYMVSLTNSLREANNDLKLQLRRERTEERRKMFQIADRRHRNGSNDSGDENTPFGKWKKLLPMLPNKDGDISSKDNEELTQEAKSKDILTKFVRRTLKKKAEQRALENNNMDDGTDNEQQDNLPEDSQKNTEVPENVPEGSQNSSGTKFYIKEQTKTTKTTSITKKYNGNSHRRNSSKSICSSKEIRQDSLSSNWSDNIPVITISKTESNECILETQKVPKNPKKSLPHQDKVQDQEENLQIAEPQCPPSSSTETLVTIRYEEEFSKPSNGKPKVPIGDGFSIDTESSNVDLEIDGAIKEIEETAKTLDMTRNLENGNGKNGESTSQSKTESSTDYQE